MIWIFALGIVALAVFHRGFRNVALSLAGIGICALGIILVLASVNHWQL
jgi:hypothetical protein